MSARELLESCVRAALLAGCAANVALVGSAAAAPNKVTFSEGGNPATTVQDGDPGDLDPDAAEILVHFTLSGQGGDWVATGSIIATTTNPAGATLVVTDTEIRNVTGDFVLGAIIQVDHYFDPIVSFTQQYTAHIDGTFDKIGGGILGNFTLDDSAYLNGAVLIDNFHFMDGLVLAPVPFDDTSLPLHLDTVNRQTERFIFYIDELDNTINLFDSASILPSNSSAVPALGPTTLLALGLALVGLGLVWLRRRAVR